MASNKDSWQMCSLIANKCLLFNGVIFGGYCRDAYIHEHDAKLFYEKYPDANYDDNVGEFKGRHLIPTDIDCIILESDRSELIHYLEYKYHVKRVITVNSYDENADVGVLNKYNIYNIKTGAQVDIDLMVQQGRTLLHPNKQPDLDVNTILLTRSSFILNPDIWHSDSLSRGINLSIIQAKSLKREAEVFKFGDTLRLRKMIQQGWTLTYSYTAVTIHTDDYEGVCIVCQDTIAGTHTTMINCHCAHICMLCLQINYSSITKCTICSSPVDIENLSEDIRIYSILNSSDID